MGRRAPASRHTAPTRLCRLEGATVNNQWFSKVAVWLVIALVLFAVFKQFDRGVTQGSQIGYSDFLEEVRAKRIKAVTLQEGNGGTEILGGTNDDKRLRLTAPQPH